MTAVAAGPCCALCGAERRQPLVDFDGFVIERCERCRTAAVTQKPAAAPDHDLVYAAHYAQECSSEKAKACWDLTLELTDNLHGVSRLLDLGCGEGVYLDLVRQHGIETTGVEIAAAAAERARKHGHRIDCVSAEDFGTSLTGTQSLVTCWDLLEHVTHPGRVLANAHAALVDGGRLIVLTPMMDSVYDRLGILSSRATAGRFEMLLRMCWSQEHLFRFHAAGMTAVLEDLGFHSVRTRPVLQLSLGAERYAGSEILPAWTRVRALNHTMSRAAVTIARLLFLHNKILVDAIKGA